MTSKIQSLTLIPKLMVAAFALTAVAGCAEESPKLKGFQSAEKITTSEAASFNPKVDILFVIDNSGSMGTLQDNLALNIPKFIAEIQKSTLLDYHIGVVTSTIYEGSSCGSACRGELYSASRGDRFVSKKTPRALEQLADNLLVGINGGGAEKFFAPVVAALSSPLVNGINAGFYRPDATLAVIFLTDSDDQSSNLTVDQYLQFVNGLKNGNAKKVLTYGIVIPVGAPTSSDCYRSGEPEPERITEAVQKSNGLIMNVCDADFGTQVGLVASDVAQKVSKVLYLNRAPDPKSISVRYGTQIIPEDRLKGWWLDIRRNALVFGDELELTVQPEGTNLEVNFNAAGYEMK